MEENQNIEQEPISKTKKGNYITGTIGAIKYGQFFMMTVQMDYK